MNIGGGTDGRNAPCDRPASIAWVTGITLVIALGLAWKHAWHRLFVFGLIVPGGMTVNTFLKWLLHRPRPLIEDTMSTLAGYSFPSGHTMAATLLYGGLVWLAWRAINTWLGQMAAVLGPAF
jgi:membrane-associated phospholipid phosphatase